MPEQLLSLLGTNLVDFLVYGAIALVVLVGVCKCIYPVFRNGSPLNRAVAKLEKTAGNNQRASFMPEINVAQSFVRERRIPR